jgi:hypothetical protein
VLRVLKVFRVLLVPKVHKEFKVLLVHKEQ